MAPVQTPVDEWMRPACCLALNPERLAQGDGQVPDQGVRDCWLGAADLVTVVPAVEFLVAKEALEYALLLIPAHDFS